MTNKKLLTFKAYSKLMKTEGYIEKAIGKDIYIYLKDIYGDGAGLYVTVWDNINCCQLCNYEMSNNSGLHSYDADLNLIEELTYNPND